MLTNLTAVDAACSACDLSRQGDYCDPTKMSDPCQNYLDGCDEAQMCVSDHDGFFQTGTDEPSCKFNDDGAYCE